MLQQTSLLGNNPFAVLTAVVAPAILTNASSVLALGTSNRLARVVDRTRVVYADLARSVTDSMEYSEWMEQLEALRLRGTTLLRALRLFYAALAGRWFVTRSWAALTDVVVKEFTVRGVQGTPGVTGNTYMFALFGLRTFNSLSSGPMNPPFA